MYIKLPSGLLHGVGVEVAAGLADRRAFAVVRGQAVVDRIGVRGDGSGGGGRLDDVGEAEVGEVADGLFTCGHTRVSRLA